MKVFIFLLVLSQVLQSQSLDSLFVKDIEVNGSAVQGIREGYSKLFVESSIKGLQFEVHFAQTQSNDFYFLNTEGGYQLFFNINKLKRAEGFSSVYLLVSHKEFYQKNLHFNFLPSRSYHIAITANLKQKGFFTYNTHENQSVSLFIDSLPGTDFLLEGSRNVFRVPSGIHLIEIRGKGYKPFISQVEIKTEKMHTLGTIELNRDYFDGDPNDIMTYIDKIHVSNFFVSIENSYDHSVDGFELGVSKFFYDDMAFHLNFARASGWYAIDGYSESLGVYSSKEYELNNLTMLGGEVSYWLLNNKFISLSAHFGLGIGYRAKQLKEGKNDFNDPVVFNQGSNGFVAFRTMGFSIEIIRYWSVSLGYDLRGYRGDQSALDIVSKFRINYSFSLYH